MRQYTTPTLTLTIKDQLLSGFDDVYVTVQYSGGVYQFHDPSYTVGEKDTVISIPFTQLQTSKLKTGEKIAVQVNWMEDGKRYATNIAYLTATENLLKEVLP